MKNTTEVLENTTEVLKNKMGVFSHLKVWRCNGK